MSGRKNLVRDIPFEYSEVFGLDIRKAAEYLIKIADEHKDKEIYLEENWTGYEDMEMKMYFMSPETNEEYNDRIAHEKEMKERAQRAWEQEQERDKKIAEYNKLKSELGFR